MERHPNLPEKNIGFKGRIKINAVWILKDIKIYECGILPFGLSIGYHRDILIDIPLQYLIGECPIKIPWLKAR